MTGRGEIGASAHHGAASRRFPNGEADRARLSLPVPGEAWPHVDLHHRGSGSSLSRAPGGVAARQEGVDVEAGAPPGFYPYDGQAPWPFLSHRESARSWRRGEFSFSALLMGAMAVSLVVAFLFGRIGWPW